MESEARVAALAGLDPLLALRYSATHRTPYNLVYRLTPYDAYRQGLVKRIEVASVVQETDANRAFVRVERIDPAKRTVTARLTVHRQAANGTVKEQTVTARSGDRLRDTTGRPEYDGFDIEEISYGGGYVRFANDVEVRLGEEQGADKTAIFAAQIRYTIEEHARKQRRLRQAGIKVLSLFFIDRVANYAPEDGVIRQIFHHAFDDVKARYPEGRKLAHRSVAGRCWPRPDRG